MNSKRKSVGAFVLGLVLGIALGVAIAHPGPFCGAEPSKEVIDDSR